MGAKERMKSIRQTPEKKKIEKEANKQRMANLRKNQTEADKLAEREANKKHIANLRKNQTEAEKLSEKEATKERVKSIRQTPEKKKIEKEANQQYKIRIR